MKKLISQIICSFVALLAVIGLTTGDAYAQLAPGADSLLDNAANQVIAAATDEDGPVEPITITCDPNDKSYPYYPNPEDPGSFFQCSKGVPYQMPCPAGLVFNPYVEPGPVCDWPSSVPSS